MILSVITPSHKSKNPRQTVAAILGSVLGNQNSCRPNMQNYQLPPSPNISRDEKEKDFGLEPHLFPGSAVTKYCTLQGVNNENALSPSSGG